MKQILSVGNLPLTEEQLRAKAARFCVTEEQCRFSVRKKLMSWGASPKTSEQVLEWLVNQGFIDELRYAKAYCESKVRTQHWGKKKIEYQLRMNQIDREHIMEGLMSIDNDAYEQMMRHVAENKFRTLKGDDDAVCDRLVAFLQSRGFELERSYNVSRELIKSAHEKEKSDE